MSILIFNCGSTSLKWRLCRLSADDSSVSPELPLARGVIEDIGRCGQASIWSVHGLSRFERTGFADHFNAAVWLLDQLSAADLLPDDLTATGHRMIYGGDRYIAPVQITDDILHELRSLDDPAAAFNQAALGVLEACRTSSVNHLPMFGVFDTAFHATMPPHTANYPISPTLARHPGIRRHGFFGLAHRSLVEQYSVISGTPRHRVRAVTVHLGNGCSTAAVRNGISTDTSAGLTPVDGLMSVTGSGSIDPLVSLQLTQSTQLTAEQIGNALTCRSGLQGVAGRLSDMSAIIMAEQQGDPRAALAVDMFCHRVRQSIAASMATLGGADAIIFAGGIGEHEPLIRARICGNMQWCGVTLNAAANEWITNGSGRISADHSKVHVFVIPADEERMMLEDIRGCLKTVDCDQLCSEPSEMPQTLRYCPS